MACVQNDRRAIKALYEHCFRVFMPVCFRYHNNEEDARASLNIAFMKILRGLGSIDGDLNFTAWAKRVIINTLIDEYRKKKNYASRVVSRESDQELDFYAETMANDAESGFGYESLLKLVSQLPEISGKVFNLYVIDGFNHKEIGELLGMSEGTSKWHLSTARKILRKKIENAELAQRKLVI